MTEEHHDLTSALLDGELDRDSQLRAVSQILSAGTDELERFGRYRLIGDVLRGESSVLAASVADKVHAALQNEPVVFAPRPKQSRRWVRPLGGLAVAASVAVIAVVVAPHMLTSATPEGEAVNLAADVPRAAAAPRLVSAGPAVNTEPQGDRPAQAPGRWQALNPALEERLNRLVIEHHEFGGRTGINGPVSHIGFVGYDAR
jgi:sigma-E factor negative regulatory protein RseA